MLDHVIEAIEEWMRTLLTGIITENMSSMYEDVNAKVGLIAGAVGQTPQGWNAGIYSMIRSLSDTAIMPIAGIIITYVLCCELIAMVMEKNNMQDIETWMLFKFVMKAGIAVYLVGHTIDTLARVWRLWYSPAIRKTVSTEIEKCTVIFAAGSRERRK